MAERKLTAAVFHEGTRWVLPDHHLDRIREAAGDAFEVRPARTRKDLARLLGDTDALIGLPLTGEQVAQDCPNLRWIQLIQSVGDTTDAILEAVKRDIRLTTASTVRAPQIAEHALALALAMLRRIDLAVIAQAEHRWAADELVGRIRDLHGCTVGVIAGSTVGAEIAQRFHAFGTRVIATSLRPGDELIQVEEMVPLARLDEMLKRADVVVVAAPRTALTDGLIGKKQLAAMGEDAFLIDVSRGGVVEHTALLEALRRKRIAGAGLDAFEVQPLPVTSPLWTMPNVIVSPGVAAASPKYWDHAVEHFCRNVRRFAEQRELLDEVDAGWYRPRQ